MAGTITAASLDSGASATAPLFKANGTEIGTLCRAWVNFNGTGTVAIRGSFNVSSITDNGAGTYTVNYTNAMPDANYAVLGTCSSNNGYNNDGIGYAVNITMNTTTPVQFNTSGVRVSTGVGNGAPSDGGANYMQIAIFR